MPPTLAAIHVYPLKSGAGIRLPRAEVVRTGLRFDRRWMVVDERGRFVTQREEPRLALVRVGLGPVATEPDRLELSAPGVGALELPLGGGAGPRVEVDIWGERVRAERVSAEAARWISAHLGRPADVVRFPDDEQRPVDPAYGGPADRVAFADGYPFLLASEASLEALNERLRAAGERAIGMERFRPNLVVTGAAPFEEDGWGPLTVGELRLRAVKPCARCVITTVDPRTAAAGREPLRTLATFRRDAASGSVLFGQNLVHDDVAPADGHREPHGGALETVGTLRTGDPIRPVHPYRS